MVPPLLTKPSTPRLSELARHVAVPQGIVSTGWPAVLEKCTDLGVSFRPWQPGVGQLILAKRADGKYAATIGGTGLSIPRQTGKTFIVGAIVFALCLLRPGLTVIWTAHRLRTAAETFGKMQAFAKRKRIAPHVSRIVLGSGDEAVLFHNGSRILFGARAAGFGLGFDEVDVLVLDEAQRLTETTLDDMIPATNQSRQDTSALLLFMGTPPRPTDQGDVFTRMRTDALAGDADTAWVEFGADPKHRPAPLPEPLSAADWKQIERANPSYPADTPREAILRMRKKLGADSFLREGLGIWDELDLHRRVIPRVVWDALAVEPEKAPAPSTPPSSLAVDMSHDRVIAIDGCWLSQTSAHVEVLELNAGSDEAAVEWLARRAGRRIPVVVDAFSPAASMVPALKSRKVRVIVVNAGADMAKACGGFFAASMSGRLTHAGQPLLDDAVAGARKRTIGNAGGWGWDRKDPTVNLAPLVAATLAHFGAVVTTKHPSPGGRARKAVVL